VPVRHNYFSLIMSCFVLAVVFSGALHAEIVIADPHGNIITLEQKQDSAWVCSVTSQAGVRLGDYPAIAVHAAAGSIRLEIDRRYPWQVGSYLLTNGLKELAGRPIQVVVAPVSLSFLIQAPGSVYTGSAADLARSGVPIAATLLGVSLVDTPSLAAEAAVYHEAKKLGTIKLTTLAVGRFFGSFLNGSGPCGAVALEEGGGAFTVEVLVRGRSADSAHHEFSLRNGRTVLVPDTTAAKAREITSLIPVTITSTSMPGNAVLLPGDRYYATARIEGYSELKADSLALEVDLYRNGSLDTTMRSMPGLLRQGNDRWAVELKGNDTRAPGRYDVTFRLSAVLMTGTPIRVTARVFQFYVVDEPAMTRSVYFSYNCDSVDADAAGATQAQDDQLDSILTAVKALVAAHEKGSRIQLFGYASKDLVRPSPSTIRCRTVRSDSLLSQLRANSVAEWLLRSGIPAGVIREQKGLGQFYEQNESEDQRVKNRRVEIKVYCK
jgi:hypothetical protein